VSEMPFFEDLKRKHGGEAGCVRSAGRGNPPGRFAQPEELAAGILDLSPDEAADITGTDPVVDGGFTA